MQSISHFKVIILLVSLVLVIALKKVSLYVKPTADIEYQQHIAKINQKITELTASPTPTPSPTAKPKKKKRKHHN